MKNYMMTLGLSGALGSMAIAGVDAPAVLNADAPRSVKQDAFSQARKPISNPTLFDLATPGTNLHPIFFSHSLPGQVNLAGGGQAPAGGDVQLYALQFEYALSERLSIVATKDGYVDFNANGALSDESGFANLGGGLKYAFLLDEASRTALSGAFTLELPTGNSDVLQGEGEGLANIIGHGLKLVDDWQFAGSAGVQLPFSGEQSTMSFVSSHVSYEVKPWFIPLVELNWFHVLDAGNGSGNYPSQVGGNLPALLPFEAGDVFNLGSRNAAQNRDFVTVAAGFRSRLSENVYIGAAYEVPLTDEQDSVMEDRFTLDLVWNF